MGPISLSPFLESSLYMRLFSVGQYIWGPLLLEYHARYQDEFTDVNLTRDSETSLGKFRNCSLLMGF